VTVEVEGQPLHMFVRVHDGGADIRASGTIPAELERGLRATLVGEGLRLDSFTQGERHSHADAREREPHDGPPSRTARAASSAHSTAPATPRTNGARVSVRA
jgi:hypothetical protein